MPEGRWAAAAAAFEANTRVFPHAAAKILWLGSMGAAMVP